MKSSTKEININDLAIHESMTIQMSPVDNTFGHYYIVTRVVGGWIYTNDTLGENRTPVFVPNPKN